MNLVQMQPEKTQPRTMCGEGEVGHNKKTRVCWEFLQWVTNNTMILYVTAVFLSRHCACQPCVWSIVLKYMDLNLMTLAASRQSIKCGGIKREEKTPIIIHFSSGPLSALALLGLVFPNSGIKTNRLHLKSYFDLFCSSELSRQCLLTTF